MNPNNVSATFNVKDLTPYLDDDDDSDLRTNHFQPGADDVHHGNYNPSCKAKTNVLGDEMRKERERNNYKGP